MTTIRELWVRLGANTDKASVQAFDKALGQVKQTGAAVIKVMAGLSAAAGAAAFGLFKLMRQTADAADKAAKGAQRFGITTETFQELDHAAQLSGSNIEAVGTGLKNLARRADEAARGNKTAAEMFRRLGLRATDAGGQLKATDELLMDLADRIVETDDPTRQLAMAVEALGRSGEALLPMLRQGRKGIQEMRADAADGVISAEAAAQFESFNDNLLRSRRIMEGWRNTLTTALLPRVNELLTRFIQWARANRELIKTRIEAWAERIGKALDTAAQAASAVNKQVETMGGWETVLARVGKALAAIGIAKFLGKLGSLAGALKMLAALFSKAGLAAAVALAKPIAIGLAVAAAIAAIVLGVQDLIVFMRGGDSVIGRFLERLGAVEQIKGLISAVGDAFVQVGRFLIGWGKILLRFWTGVFKMWWAVAGPVFKLLGGAVLWFWKTITWPVLTALAEGFAWAFGQVADALDWLVEHWDAVMGAFVLMAKDAGQWIKDGIGGAIEWVQKMLDRLLGGIKAAREAAAKLSPGKAIGAAKGLIGRVGQAFAPSTDRNPRTQPVQNSVTNAPTLNVQVNAETNASPEQIASATAQKTEEALGRTLRFADAAVAGGEM